MSSYFERRLDQTSKPWLIDRYFGNLYMDPADKMPLDKISSFQKDSLIEITAIAYSKCPFYKEKMKQAGVTPAHIRTLADIKRLPFLEKEELRGNPWAIVACNKEKISCITVSTGTSGQEEIYIPYTWKDYTLSDMTPRYPSLFPIDPGDICIDALPYEMSSAGLSFHKLFMDACLATVFNAGKGGAYSTPEKTVKALRDLKPNVIITTPSWAISVYEAAEEAGFDLSSLNLKKMWLTGEGCSDSFRKRVEAIYGTTANMYYGSLEVGGIGIECDKHDGYHLLHSHVIVEIVDPDTKEVLEPGEIGEIVVTDTLRYDTPLIRYCTKDLGYIETGRCKCGVTPRRLFLRGRKADQIEIGDTSFSPFYLEEFLMQNEEVGNWYQFIISKQTPDSLKVRTELAKGVTATPDLADKIASKLEFAVGVPCEVELVDKMPRTAQKAKRVIYEE